ncbi:MAG: hypothetical protein SGPRY_002931, partial [Prymnesium sp.]
MADCVGVTTPPNEFAASRPELAATKPPLNADDASLTTEAEVAFDASGVEVGEVSSKAIREAVVRSSRSEARRSMRASSRA